MGKKLGGGGGNGSWLSAVKRAFRSPSKEDNDQKTSRRRLDQSTHDLQLQEDEKKREKRRWLFRRAPSNSIQQPVKCEETISKSDQQKHAIAVAAATTAAAEAAMATAKAAAQIIRLTKPSLHLSPPPPPPPVFTSLREHHAAIVIQTVFRGYLARRALQALRGIVKLQAMVRGHNVRKQTKTALKYMHVPLRVQARVNNAPRPSHEATRKSMFAESTNLWDSRYMQDIRARKSTQSRAGSWIPENWDDCPRTLKELDALLQARKEAALTRERSLAYAFSQQIWDYEKDPSAQDDHKELHGGDIWLDSSRPYCYSSPLISRSQLQSTPHHRGLSPQAPLTPSPAKMKPLHVRPSSPRALREARRSYSTANTPSLASARCSGGGSTRCTNESPANYAIPNYMAATESAKAKVRSQSATRQRPSTPERERGPGSVRKRLSYPVQEIYNGYGVLRSPSFKSVQGEYMGIEQRSSLSSCCADSIIGGEISPCSTTDLKRWLR